MDALLVLHTSRRSWSWRKLMSARALPLQDRLSGQTGRVDPMGGHHSQGRYLGEHLANSTSTAQLLSEGSIRHPSLSTKPFTVVRERRQVSSVQQQQRRPPAHPVSMWSCTDTEVFETAAQPDPAEAGGAFGEVQSSRKQLLRRSTTKRSLHQTRKDLAEAGSRQNEIAAYY